jgi:hypothetical protein
VTGGHGRRHPIASENTRAALEQELKARAEGGAGLAELLRHLTATNQRLGPLRRLSDKQYDELSLYCWTLQQSNPTGMLWGRARTLWGTSGTGPRRSEAPAERPRRRAKR